MTSPRLWLMHRLEHRPGLALGVIVDTLVMDDDERMAAGPEWVAVCEAHPESLPAHDPDAVIWYRFPRTRYGVDGAYPRDPRYADALHGPTKRPVSERVLDVLAAFVLGIVIAAIAFYSLSNR